MTTGSWLATTWPAVRAAWPVPAPPSVTSARAFSWPRARLVTRWAPKEAGAREVEAEVEAGRAGHGVLYCVRQGPARRTGRSRKASIERGRVAHRPQPLRRSRRGSRLGLLVRVVVLVLLQGVESFFGSRSAAASASAFSFSASSRSSFRMRLVVAIEARPSSSSANRHCKRSRAGRVPTSQLLNHRLLEPQRERLRHVAIDSSPPPNIRWRRQLRCRRG
jgi:hypothetical protein